MRFGCVFYFGVVGAIMISVRLVVYKFIEIIGEKGLC